MKKSLCCVALVMGMVATAHAEPKWMDGKVVYKIGGNDTEFTDPADACKASAAALAKSGNKKTYASVKDGTSSTSLTCGLKEADGSPFDQTNQVSKVLKCPDGTTSRSTDNSGDFAKIRCKCDDKKGCPKPGAVVVKTDAKPAPTGNWMDGKVAYKIGGVDTQFTSADDACKASAAELTKKGNKKSFGSSKEGSSSTSMTCMLKEADGKPFEQLNQVSKLLVCPAGTTARSSDNSGEFASMKCKCDDKKVCPKT